MPAPTASSKPTAAVNLFGGADDDDDDSSDDEQQPAPKPAAPEEPQAKPKPGLLNPLAAFAAHVEPDFLHTAQLPADDGFLAEPTKRRRVQESAHSADQVMPDISGHHQEEMPETGQPRRSQADTSRQRQAADAARRKATEKKGGKGGKGSESFSKKEKRKRDMGMQSRDKTNVEEEKRVLREFGGGYD